jgi:iron(III) transport system permease protein
MCATKLTVSRNIITIFCVARAKWNNTALSWAELNTAILNTLAVAAGVLVLTLPIACFLAIALVRTNVAAGRLAWLAIFSQFVVPLYALVGAWSAGFGTQGWWPLSQVSVAGNPAAGLAAVTFVHAMAALPSAVLIITLGLYWTRRSREELALVEGGTANVIVRVLLPELRGWIAAAGFWSIVPVLTEMVVTNLYQVPTLPEQIYLDVSLGTATARTYVVSVLLCMLPLLVLAWSLRRWLPELSTFATQVSQHAPSRLPLGPWRWPASAMVWSVVLIVVVVPLLNLLIKAGWQSSLDPSGVMQHHWTLQRLMRTLWETVTLFTAEFRWSATLAIASSCVALAVAAVLRWLGQSANVRHLVNALALVLIAMPGPLVATLTTRLFLHVPIPGLSWLYDHTLLAPILAQQTRLLPLAWLIVGGILATISSQTWELAAIDRLPVWTRLVSIVLKPTWQLWLAGWLLLAATSAGELSTHLLLLPPGVTTVAQRLFEFLHFGMRYQDSGLCLALVALGWLVAIVVWNTRTGRA